MHVNAGGRILWTSGPHLGVSTSLVGLSVEDTLATSRCDGLDGSHGITGMMKMEGLLKQPMR